MGEGSRVDVYGPIDKDRVLVSDDHTAFGATYSELRSVAWQVRLAGCPINDGHVVFLGLRIGEPHRAAVGVVMEEDLDAGSQSRLVADGEGRVMFGVRDDEECFIIGGGQHVGRQQHGSEQSQSDHNAQEDEIGLDTGALAVDPGNETTHDTESFR